MNFDTLQILILILYQTLFLNLNQQFRLLLSNMAKEVGSKVAQGYKKHLNDFEWDSKSANNGIRTDVQYRGML